VPEHPNSRLFLLPYSQRRKGYMGAKTVIDPAKIKCVEYKCLIKPDEVEAKTSGGIYLPDIAKEQEETAQVMATLVAIGGNCFEDWQGSIPQVGDRVYVAKYAGIHRVPGMDGLYRFVNDKDIIAIIDEG
jgi:co-chaperonin GroES (HSP10)